MTRAEQRQEWGKLISAYRASGMGAKKWCAANHVQFHQLKYRLYGNRVETAAQPVRWLPVTVDEPSGQDDTGLLIRVGAVSIEVRPDFDPNLLKDVVRVLVSC
jgi:hypothetical protein